jgi:hypothetical protein
MENIFIYPDRCIARLECELACVLQHLSKHHTVAFHETAVPGNQVHAIAGSRNNGAVGEDVRTEVLWPVGFPANVMRHEFRQPLFIPSRQQWRSRAPHP